MILYFPRKNGHERVWFSVIIGGLKAEGYPTVKVAIRHKRSLFRAARARAPRASFSLTLQAAAIF
jgi:hypothetical protein